ncbi:hypothetical protein HID58_062415 [Brassica napus]|uniref:Glycosyltransferase n=1 Tax=Brassica napus TaxID=3708 RepID=A0A816JVN7_BRANA|nr:UDP-glycosyltransferase 86A2 [Brassica napus]KAH0886319.1 hypothetical protein HID58_062415 [Brassica napus]CAF1863242.1 unnamed protein product [Brassica napus]
MADVKNPNNHHKHHRLHALLIPYPFQGHVNPFVHLAIKLASQGITVTFVNTHYNHHQINSGDIFAGVRSESGLDIRYATVSDGLPLGFNRSLNHDQYQSSLLHVFSAHVEELVESLVGEGVNVMIADTFFVWPSVVARKFGLVCVSFWTEAALVFSLYYHMDLLRIHGHFGAQETRRDLIDYIPGVEAINPKDTASYLQETDISSVVHQIIFKAFEDVKKVDFVLCNTIHQFESKTIRALNSKIPFYAIGPIIPFNLKTGSSVTTSLWSESDCTQWLNAKPAGSVLYISFGSYAHVTKKDLVEIAHGISLSKVNFVWVVRPDIVSSDETNPLPEGFESEAGDRGIVIPWCCQMTVLSHPSIGGFLTHCGWNSILESIWCEVPLLCFPLLTDQVTNRKLVVDDWKIGMNLCEDRGFVGRDEVKMSIGRLMCGESREGVRGAIGRVKMSLEGALKCSGSSEENLGLFVDGLVAKVGLSNGKA